jgi:hypothetical protein
MAIKISNSTIIDDNRHIVSLKSASANKVALSSSTTSVDLSLGSYFTQSVSSNKTYTFTNIPTSTDFYSFVMEITLSASVALTWPSSVKWPRDIAPSLSASKTHLFVFITDDGGSRWRAASLIDYVS